MFAKSTAPKIVALLVLMAAKAASAGNFSMACSYTNANLQKCAAVVADLVTDKFVAKYPAAKFQIFAYSNVHKYTSGGYAAFAVAGVIPKDSGQFPLFKYSATRIDGTDKTYGQIEIAAKELEAYRAAVKSLMDECEISPNCDVYTARK